MRIESILARADEMKDWTDDELEQNLDNIRSADIALDDTCADPPEYPDAQVLPPVLWAGTDSHRGL